MLRDAWRSVSSCKLKFSFHSLRSTSNSHRETNSTPHLQKGNATLRKRCRNLSETLWNSSWIFLWVFLNFRSVPPNFRLNFCFALPNCRLNLFLNFFVCASEFSSEFLLNFSEFCFVMFFPSYKKFRKIQKKFRRKFRSANKKIQTKIQKQIPRKFRKKFRAKNSEQKIQSNHSEQKIQKNKFWAENSENNSKLNSKQSQYEDWCRALPSVQHDGYHEESFGPAISVKLHRSQRIEFYFLVNVLAIETRCMQKSKYRGAPDLPNIKVSNLCSIAVWCFGFVARFCNEGLKNIQMLFQSGAVIAW